MKTWIAEIPGRCVKTVLIQARTRREAKSKLREIGATGIEGLDVHYTQTGFGRIVGEDKAEAAKEGKG